MQMMSGDGFSIIPSAIDGFAQDHQLTANPSSHSSNPSNPVAKKKRNLPGTPDPDAEVIALSPTTLMATNRFVCEICNKGFQRDQNLQLHRRGHNLPWKLRQRTKTDVIKKKVYICPEKSCVHHDPARALGDLTGIKKHFSRKHGEKKWKCEKCSKKYAVQSDWKAHSKTCGTREYKCDCGTLFSRKDSFITHRAFCDALTEESARLTSVAAATNLNFGNDHQTITNNNMMNPQISQFSGPGFRPDFNGMADHDQHQHEKPRLMSLWMNNQPANSHQLNLMDLTANPNPYAPSSSTGFAEMVQMASAANNLFGSSSSMSNNFGSSNTNLQFPVGFEKSSTSSTSASTSTLNNANLSLSSPISVGLLKDQEGGTSTTTTMTTLSNKRPAAPMSATALLQKAAQLGSTRSNNNPSFSSLGVTSSSNNSSLNQNSRSNELHQVFQNAKQSEQNLSTVAAGGAGSVAMSEPNLSSFTGSSSNHHTTLEQLMNMQQSSGLNIHRGSSGSIHGHQNSLTRDFLGMGAGGDQLSHRPLLPQELAKFASMSAAMGLSQFTGNH